MFQGLTGYFWTAYACWLFIAAPFSSWKSSSLLLAWGYLRSEFVLFLVIAGLAVTWGECRMVLRAIAWGCIAMLAVGGNFRNLQYQDRLGLASGTVANPNDYACVLLLLLPFVLWLVLTSKWFIVRVATLPALAYGAYLILSTASRGALLGMLVEVALFLFLGTMRQRIALVFLGAILVPAAAITLSRHALNRITAFSSSAAGSAEAVEAMESSKIRQYMLLKSIEHTIKNPLFGVGPGQMVNFEGQRSKALSGGYGVWQNAHNTFIQASSECGIPALIFFAGGLVSAWRRLMATYRKARGRQDCADIRTALFCVLVGMSGFCVAATFLNFAYLFYAPALGALAIMISAAAAREFEIRSADSGAIPQAAVWNADWPRVDRVKRARI